jgi:periplasmic divalent cation tolerance protein
MTDKLLVLTTTGSQAEAEKIARTLVDRQLAACVNIVPQIQSVYRWEGKVETAEEYLLLVKTRQDREAEVCAAIRELHSYELPECIVISIEGGSKEYLQWLSESVV